jgi:hypothetical protein
MAAEVTDILVRTASPALLDQTVQQLGPAVVVGAPDYAKVDGCYVVRVFGNPGFIKFAITNQGYGEVVRELEKPLLVRHADCCDFAARRHLVHTHSPPVIFRCLSQQPSPHTEHWPAGMDTRAPRPLRGPPHRGQRPAALLTGS